MNVSNCLLGVLVLVGLSQFHTVESLTPEERSYLSSELRSWLAEAKEGILQQEYNQPLDNSVLANFLDRRLRNSGTPQAKSGEKWNNIGMHNLFRLDKRSRY